MRGDTITCLDCGTSWKEFSGSGTAVAADNRAATLKELRILARNGSAEPFTEDAHPKSVRVSMQRGNTGFASTGFALGLITLAFAGVIGGAMWMSSQPGKHYAGSQTATSAPISVSDIKLRERIGRDGKKIITVAGRIENATSRSHPVPPLAIILRRKDGGEIIRWRYTSAKPVLSSGTATRFASSIQYDTPVIAYADAVFE